MHLTIAHSPDSDDAYMMAPLAFGWLDPEGFTFDFGAQGHRDPQHGGPPGCMT